jgi:hypothetical protein
MAFPLRSPSELPMLFLQFSCRVRRVAIALVFTAMTCAESGAIEMFTYFGDGSRIGLPSLEVPVEAYPGIPLRSDRLRARRRAMRMGPASAPVSRRGGPSQTITIRAMPEAIEKPLAPPVPTPAGRATRNRLPEAEEVPVAPAPEEVPLPSDR